MKASRPSGRVACYCAVAFLFAQNAFAEPHSEDTADAHVRRGLELRRSGSDAAALDEFERAQALAPTPRIRAQIGLALQALGRWREAEEVQLEVLSDMSDPWVREHGDLLRESLATAQHHLAWLSVDCSVAGAELVVNGERVSNLPLSNPVRVVAGATVLQVRADGYEPAFRTIYALEGTRTRELVVLVASPRENSPAKTTVLRNDPNEGKRTAAWVTLTAGGVLVAGGIAAGVVSAVYAGIYNDDSRCFVWPLTRDQRCGGDRAIAETTRATAIGTLAAGGIAALVGAILLEATPRSSASAAIPLACGVGPASLGCAWHVLTNRCAAALRARLLRRICRSRSERARRARAKQHCNSNSATRSTLRLLLPLLGIAGNPIRDGPRTAWSAACTATGNLGGIP